MQTLHPEDERARWVWSNVNVGEALPGVATPLTWSIAAAFSDVGFRRAFGALGCSVPEGVELVGRFHGRIYLNLTHFLAIAAQVPALDPKLLLELGGGVGPDALLDAPARPYDRNPAPFAVTPTPGPATTRIVLVIAPPRQNLRPPLQQLSCPILDTPNQPLALPTLSLVPFTPHLPAVDKHLLSPTAHPSLHPFLPLQAALPFKSKPKVETKRKRKSLAQTRAVVLEPEERKRVSLIALLHACPLYPSDAADQKNSVALRWTLPINKR